MGGTGAIVTAFCKLFEDCGGIIRLNTEVSRLIIEDKRVAGLILADGTKEMTDSVICNGDLAFCYKNLVPKKDLPLSLNVWLKNIQYSNSLVVIYFGTKKKYSDSKLSHHNLILGNDYKKFMRDVFSAKRLPRELGLYLHMPSASDPSIAPDGCESFYVLSLVPNLDGKINWKEILPEYTEKVITFLEDNYLPDLKKNIVVQHTVSPLHFQSTLNSFKGAAFSIKPSMAQSGYFRPQVKSKWFKDLYFVGASVHPGAGVPAVLASGKIAANEISPTY